MNLASASQTAINVTVITTVEKEIYQMKLAVQVNYILKSQLCNPTYSNHNYTCKVCYHVNKYLLC